MDRDMREFIDVTAEMTAHGESLDSIYQQVVAGEEIVSVEAFSKVLIIQHFAEKFSRSVQEWR